MRGYGDVQELSRSCLTGPTKGETDAMLAVAGLASPLFFLAGDGFCPSALRLGAAAALAPAFSVAGVPSGEVFGCFFGPGFALASALDPSFAALFLG